MFCPKIEGAHITGGGEGLAVEKYLQCTVHVVNIHYVNFQSRYQGIQKLHQTGC